MPWEVEERRPDLGAIFVRCAEWGFEERIVGETLFVPAAAVDERMDGIAAWVRETAARDILPDVFAYTLTEEADDFESLELVRMPWFPRSISSGDRFSYEGTAYPLPSRGITLSTSGGFVISGCLEDETGELWFETRNLRTGEHLFVSQTLLLTATFV